MYLLRPDWGKALLCRQLTRQGHPCLSLRIESRTYPASRESFTFRPGPLDDPDSVAGSSPVSKSSLQVKSTQKPSRPINQLLHLLCPLAATILLANRGSSWRGAVVTSVGLTFPAPTPSYSGCPPSR